VWKQGASCKVRLGKGLSTLAGFKGGFGRTTFYLGEEKRPLLRACFYFGGNEKKKMACRDWEEDPLKTREGKKIYRFPKDHRRKGGS